MVGGTEQGAIPFFGQCLPLKILRGCRSFDRCGGAGAVLVNDNAPDFFNAVRNPQGIGDRDLQLTGNCRSGVIDMHIPPGSARGLGAEKRNEGKPRQGDEHVSYLHGGLKVNLCLTASQY